jgi:hypothetical protein
VDELDSVALVDRVGGEIFPVYKPSVYFDYYCRVIFICAVEEFLDRKIRSFVLFRKSVEEEFQFRAFNGAKYPVS